MLRHHVHNCSDIRENGAGTSQGLQSVCIRTAVAVRRFGRLRVGKDNQEWLWTTEQFFGRQGHACL
jgi:hypothetical protein